MYLLYIPCTFWRNLTQAISATTSVMVIYTMNYFQIEKQLFDHLSTTLYNEKLPKKYV